MSTYNITPIALIESPELQGLDETTFFKHVSCKCNLAYRSDKRFNSYKDKSVKRYEMVLNL